jgi:spermidine/putrescine transport system substrate-binding protein
MNQLLRNIRGKRLNLILVSSIAALSLTLGSIPANSAGLFPDKPKGNELNLYNWSNYIDPELLKRFTAETGIKVNLGVYESNASMLAKLEAGARGYDVIVPTDWAVQVMQKKGLLQRIHRSSYPNGGNIKAAFSNPYFDRGRIYTIPYLHGITGFAYSKDVVKTAPSTWKEFFAAIPSYSGKTTIFDIKKDAIEAALRAVGGKPCTKNTGHLQKAQDLLKSIKPHLNAISATGNVTRLGNGTSVLLMMYNGATARAKKTNPNAVFVFPKDGFEIWQDNFAIPTGAQNVANAKIFLNWMMDPKNIAQASNWAEYNNAITGSDKYLKADMVNDPGVNPSSAQLAIGVPGTNCSTEVNDQYSKIWTNFMS